ncbi:hypothetical protein D9M68_951710 [compost metagenome]
MNVSCVTAKTAGTESTAKIRSTTSTMISATASGVSQVTSLPVLGSACLTVKLRPCSSLVTRKRLVRNRNTGLCSISGSAS